MGGNGKADQSACRQSTESSPCTEKTRSASNAQAFPPPRPLLSFASGMNSPLSCART